jgi:hypothetical protein
MMVGKMQDTVRHHLLKRRIVKGVTGRMVPTPRQPEMSHMVGYVSSVDLEYDGKSDAQLSAQPDGPARGFNLASIGVARRLDRTLGVTIPPA